MSEQYYQRHIVFCVNQRSNGERCCGDFDAMAMRDQMKTTLKQMGRHGPRDLRVNQAGCLGRCELGPVCVVYPEGTWYSYVDEEDIKEITERHVLGGEVVERLRLAVDD